MTFLPSLASLMLASSHLVQTGKKRERGGKREPQFSTTSYGPPKSQMHGITFHFLQVNCPVRLLHAFGDEDVEWKSSMRLLQSLQSSQVDLILRKSGNHRLMKPQGSLKKI